MQRTLRKRLLLRAIAGTVRISHRQRTCISWWVGWDENESCCLKQASRICTFFRIPGNNRRPGIHDARFDEEGCCKPGSIYMRAFCGSRVTCSSSCLSSWKSMKGLQDAGLPSIMYRSSITWGLESCSCPDLLAFFQPLGQWIGTSRLQNWTTKSPSHSCERL